MTNCSKNRVKAHFARIHPDAIMPTYGTSQSSGCDLYLCEDVIIAPGQVVLARTGIVTKPPIGYWYELCLRSSTPIKNPGLVLANGVGIIDADYCGPEDEIKIPLLNTRTVPYEPVFIGRRRSFSLDCYNIKLSKGTRIAQLVLRPLLQPDLCEISVDELKKDSRGGFGSTGEQ